MLDNIKEFFKKFNKNNEKLINQKGTNKNAAKERLHLVLMQDRANVSADFLDLMKQEIIDVIKKYIDIDERQIDVKLTNKQNSDGTTGAPALYANIPIKGIKSETRKIRSTKKSNTTGKQTSTNNSNANQKPNSATNSNENTKQNAPTKENANKEQNTPAKENANKEQNTPAKENTNKEQNTPTKKNENTEQQKNNTPNNKNTNNINKNGNNHNNTKKNVSENLKNAMNNRNNKKK